MSERPVYCQLAECPLFNPKVGCVVQAWITAGWMTRRAKRGMMTIYLEKATKDKVEMVGICQNKYRTMIPGRRN